MYVYSRLPSDRLLAGSTPGPSGGCFYLCWDVNWSRTYQITLSLFTVCFPLANVNSRSTNPPIANFLPTPIAKKKPSILLKVLFECSPFCWTSVNFLGYFANLNNSAIFKSSSRTMSSAQALVPKNMNTNLCNNTYLFSPPTAAALEQYTLGLGEVFNDTIFTLVGWIPM